MMAEHPMITLRPEKQGTFFARHPWVLNKSLAKVPAQLAGGEVVDLVLPDGRWVARGLYSAQSRIQVRLYTWDRQTEINDAFWHKQLSQAISLRRGLGLLGPAQAARLVFSEADGLSGLIVDRYADYLVVQFTAAAMLQRKATIVEWLQRELAPTGIVTRIDQRTARAEGMEEQEEWVYGAAPSGPVEFQEHGVRLQVDLNESQKTGYYLDQRDNRWQAATYFRDRDVLDVCCYIGGFSLAALRGGARSVLAVDTSQRAIDQAREHARLNEVENISFDVGDCFELLDRYRQERRAFSAIVLDPPRFASNRRGLSQAIQAYHRLNRFAMELLEPEGILVSCSCSGLVTREDFRHMLVGASRKAQRDLQILEQRGAAPDHPVRLSCPETEYLKCFICRVL
jgi:23S rRNA (cytosine1962-C5)-methyltransferase